MHDGPAWRSQRFRRRRQVRHPCLERRNFGRMRVSVGEDERCARGDEELRGEVSSMVLALENATNRR